MQRDVSAAIALTIDGEAVGGGNGTYPVYNPVRPKEVVFDAPAASRSQLDQAVASARRAQADWAALAFAERVAIVKAASEAAAQAFDVDELARLLTREHGKVLLEATFDVATTPGMAGAFAPLMAQALAPRQVGSSVLEPMPHGVVAAILPFNWPTAIMGNKILPALLAGNAVIMKSPPTCPGAVLALASALAAGLPPGVLNTLNGPGGELGAELVAHPGVDMVSFTGGPVAGRAVLAAAAPHIRPVVLELGGNDPAIVAPDLEPTDAIADRLLDAAFATSGQVCMAIKRLYVPEAKVGEWVEVLVNRLGKSVVGDGLDADVTMGPVHTESARARVKDMLDEARAAGVRVHQPAEVRPESGWLVSPAIVAAPAPDASIVTQEQFAPALPVLPYGAMDEAIRAANDTEFGLCASVWSGDEDLAESVAGRLDAGTVWTNAHGMSAMDHLAPLGGWGQSGLGFELGVEGMAAYTKLKTRRKGSL